ncbi:hypothetical protein LR48_Vigan05g114900 [Vigna angularis]|uniref:Uncharacterized protein n=1 Tax=Phaseolus angularis TaxID=3914 RepID=A0A0L9UKZ8_PHAAN|nr:hypothetical protein LR48_Vigan05g114900 [Vigna angularis]
MASSSSSRRKWKVAQIARNVNPTVWISNEDIRQKLFSLRKIKIVISHRYLKLVSVFYSNLKMSDETFCNKVKGVDMKLIKEVWIGIVVYQPINKEGFLFQIWIRHQGLIGFTKIKNDDRQQVYPISDSWSANKTDSTKTEENEWARWLCGEARALCVKGRSSSLQVGRVVAFGSCVEGSSSGSFVEGSYLLHSFGSFVEGRCLLFFAHFIIL